MPIQEAISEDSPDVAEPTLFGDAPITDSTQSVVSTVNPERFDPSIHSVDENGQPKITADGRYARKPGRKPKGTVESSTALPTVSGLVERPSLALASTIVGLIEQVASSAFDPDEWAMRPDERAGMIQAWGVYLDSKDIKDIPPGWAVVFVTGMYALPRLSKPKTRSKWTEAKAWIASKIVRLRGK